MIRNVPRGFFRPCVAFGAATLLGIAPRFGAGAARKRQYRGKRLCLPLVVFSPQGGTKRNKVLSVPLGGEGHPLVPGSHSLRRIHPYSRSGKFSCSLNEMRSNMALQIGAVAPDFEAETTEGRIKFHEWIGSNWA